MILLKGKISSIDAASRYPDKRQRATIDIENGVFMFGSFKVPHDGELQLDQEVKIYISPRQS